MPSPSFLPSSQIVAQEQQEHYRRRHQSYQEYDHRQRQQYQQRTESPRSRRELDAALRLFSLDGPGSAPMTEAAVRSAFLQLAKRTHPDTEDGSEEKFRQAQGAYSVLLEEVSRAKK